MYIALAVHHPKGLGEKARLMARQPSLAEVNSKQKGFVQMVVAEVEDENLIIRSPSGNQRRTTGRL